MISDLLMPRLNGKEACGAIRAVRPEVQVLFLSGCSADVIESRQLVEEGAPLLAKPIRSEELLAKVRELLDARPRHTA